VFRIEVGGVVPSVQIFHHVVVQVEYFDVTYQRIRVGETQPNLVALCRLQTVVEKLIHYQFAQLKYATSYGNGLV